MATEDPDLVERFTRLIHLDIDAVAVYEEVLSHTEDADLRSNFVRFRNDHAWHAEKLAAIIGDLGGEPPPAKPDLFGRLAEWVSGFRARLTEEGPVKAIHTAEEYHVNRYGEAAGWKVPEDIEPILDSFLADEQRHLAFVEEWLGAPSGR